MTEAERDRAGEAEWVEADEPFVCPGCLASTWLCICVENREIDRLRAALAQAQTVVAAARAYIEEFDCPVPDYVLRANLRGRLRDALVREVHKLDSDGGEQT